MKAFQSHGGRFLAHWNGEGPLGRESSPLYYQKGQRAEERQVGFRLDTDGCRIWSF